MTRRRDLSIRTESKIIMLSVLLLGMLNLCYAQSTTAQTDQNGAKTIKAEEAVKRQAAQRPGSNRRWKPSSSSISLQQYIVDNNSSFGKRPPPGKIKANIGVTVMRPRPATANEESNTARDMLNKQAVVFARIDDGTPLAAGDEVRISIEAPMRGYLYVIDRELYDDGTMGRALLIFPTLATYDGDNYVEPGAPRFIPDPDGVLTVTPNSQGKVQIAERLTIIISLKPLLLPRSLDYAEMKLPPGFAEEWERKWGTQAERVRLQGGVGQAQNKREQAAGRIRTKELRNKAQYLTPNDPYPQNLYQVTITPGTPALVVVPLKFRAADASSIKP